MSREQNYDGWPPIKVSGNILSLVFGRFDIRWYSETNLWRVVQSGTPTRLYTKLLDAYYDQNVNIIDFWSDWIEACRKEKHQDKDFTVVANATNSLSDYITGYFDRAGVNKVIEKSDTGVEPFVLTYTDPWTNYPGGKEAYFGGHSKRR